MLKIKRVRGRRFLSIGDEPVEIDYESLGPVVHIRGVNKDAGEGGSNGAGKSTLLEMIMYGLTGKLLKGLNHKEAINARFKGGMELDLDFDLSGVGACTIRRRRDSATKGSLIFTAAGKEYDLGLTETQNEIQRATGITYEALANVSFFGQHNRFAFLSCDAENKRKIIETLLGLEKYGKRQKLAKDRRKDLDKEIARNAKSYEEWHGIAEQSARRLAQAKAQAKAWLEKTERDKAALRQQIQSAESQLAASDAGRRQAEYEDAQKELEVVRAKLAGYDGTREKLEAIAAQTEADLSEARRKLNDSYAASQEASRVEADIARRIKEARDALDKARRLEDGAVCGNCRQVVRAEGQKHFCEGQEALIASLEADLEVAGQACIQAQGTLEFDEGNAVGLEKKAALIKERRSQLTTTVRQEQAKEARLVAVRPPDADKELLAARERIAGLKGRLDALEAEEDIGNPHEEAVAAAEREAAEADAQALEYRELIQGQEAMLPYYDYWIHGFGDEGIRSMVIEGILPPLNKRIDYWMHILMEGRFSLEFKTAKLVEDLQRRPPDGNPFVHNAMSGGEHQRIDLGLSQAFAHVTGMSAGNILSVVALDEVAANVDREGVRAVYRMINELSRDRQVLVITHDPDLQDLLAEADQLVVEKKDGITRLLRSGR